MLCSAWRTGVCVCFACRNENRTVITMKVPGFQLASKERGCCSDEEKNQNAEQSKGTEEKPQEFVPAHKQAIAIVCSAADKSCALLSPHG